MQILELLPNSQWIQFIEDWRVNSTLAGALVAVIACAAAIFSSAPYFALCFAFLAGICFFAAVHLQELGSLKQNIKELSKINDTLKANVGRLETQIGELDRQLELTRGHNVTMMAQIAAYQTTFEETKKRLEELILILRNDQNNKTLLGLIERMERASNELMTKTEKFSEILKDQIKLQYEEFRQLVIELTNPECTVKKWKELLKLQEQCGQLTGAIKLLEGHLKELEEKLQRLQKEAEKFETQNRDFKETHSDLKKTASALKEIIIESQNSFPLNPSETKLNAYGAN